MTYYVYKAVGRRRDFRWEFSSKHDALIDAVAAAKALCPKGDEIYTEPGSGLEQSYFGSSFGDRWAAMITTTPERS